MKALVVIALAGCGFTPSQGTSDAPASGSDGHSHGSDAGTVMDAHEFHDAKVFMDGPTVAPFDPANCPTDYSNNTITASPNSRYKILTDMATVKSHSDECNADHPGWTHLIVLDTVQEATQIHSHMGGNFYYVGAVQPANQATPDTGWLQLTGAAVPSAMWQVGQPNDNGGNVETNAQNFAAVDDSSGLMNDVNGSFQYQAVCECDGQAISAAALSALNQ